MSSGFGSSIPSSKRFPTREKFDTLSSVPPQPSLVHNQLHSLPQMDQAKTIGEKNDDDIDGTSLRSYIIIPRFNDLVGETPFLSIQIHFKSLYALLVRAKASHRSIGLIWVSLNIPTITKNKMT